MKRRAFLKTSAGAGIAVSAAVTVGRYEKLWAYSTTASAEKYDLVVPVEKVEYISIAHKMGLGNMNLDSLSIKRIKM